MIIKNGLRVMGGNFILSFKHALYLVCSAFISIGLFVLSARPIARILESSGWVDSLNDLFELIYLKPQKFGDELAKVATDLYIVLKSNLGSSWWNYLLCVFTFFVVPSFLFYVGEYTLASIIDKRTKSLVKDSYFLNLVRNIGRSSVYSLVKILVSLPFVVVIVLFGYGYGVLANSWFNATLLLPILIGLVVLEFAFKYTFLIGFLPEAVQGGNIFGAFARGLDMYTSNFWTKVFYFFTLFLVEVALVVFIGVFTIGAGLIVAIPAVVLLNVSVSFANFYFTRKENYYAVEGKIIKPM